MNTEDKISGTYQRRLASVQRILEVKAIPDADRIVAYKINGWWIVDQKDKYKVNDLVIYVEIDAWLSTEIAPFLSKGKEPRIYKGVAGERLRTIKLKKQLSQGLILPVEIHAAIEDVDYSNEGCDVTEELGIIKWEPEPEFRHADTKGTFPTFIPKTDQPRVQNLVNDLNEDFNTHTWLIEEKIDGSSFTCYFFNGVFGVCSRNLELKESTDNTFWSAAKSYNLDEKLKALGKNIAIQCELIGNGIQGNRYKVSGYELQLFDVFDIDNQSYLDVTSRKEFAEIVGLPVVPYIGIYNGEFDIETMLKGADGKSKLNGCVREGLIWRKLGNSRFTFKVISNQFLLGEK